MTSLVLSVVPFLLVLTTLVFIHELGHYWVARRNGVHVEAFSIGFGPELFGWTDKAGTRWRISLLPLGGYVMMLSDGDVASSRDDEKLKKLTKEQLAGALHAKTPWQRIKVAAAGPLANYIFAVFLMWGLMFAWGEVTHNPLPIIGTVSTGSPAEKAGLKSGDMVLKMGEEPVSFFAQIPKLLKDKAEQDIVLLISRNGAQQELKVTVGSREIKSPKGPSKVGVLGVLPKEELLKHGFFSAAFRAVEKVVMLTVHSFRIIGGMIVGKSSTSDLVGPLGIAQKVAELAHTNISSVLWAMAILSVSLGFINILPIPLLDGGQIMMYIAEIIKGGPISERVQTAISYVGLVIVGLLFLISTSNDVMRFWR